MTKNKIKLDGVARCRCVAESCNKITAGCNKIESRWNTQVNGGNSDTRRPCGRDGTAGLAPGGAGTGAAAHNQAIRWVQPDRVWCTRPVVAGATPPPAAAQPAR